MFFIKNKELQVNFFSYKYLMISLLFLLVGCSKTNQLQQVEQMMQDIRSSQDFLSEEQKIQTLRDYIANNGIALEITSLDGENQNKNTLMDLASAKSLRIIFSQGEVSKEFLWQPINSKNVFILFRE